MISTTLCTVRRVWAMQKAAAVSVHACLRHTLTLAHTSERKKKRAFVVCLSSMSC